MNLLTGLQDIKLPPVVVKIEEDSLRNMFVAAFLLGTLLMVINVVLKKVTA